MNVFINFRMIRTTDKKHTREEATVFLGHFWVSSQQWLCWIYFMATAGFGKGPERIWKVGSGNHPGRNLPSIYRMWRFHMLQFTLIWMEVSGFPGHLKMIHRCRWGWFGNPWLSYCEICLIQPFRIISRWPSSMIGLKIHRMSQTRCSPCWWSPAGIQFWSGWVL